MQDELVEERITFEINSCARASTLLRETMCDIFDINGFSTKWCFQNSEEIESLSTIHSNICRLDPPVLFVVVTAVNHLIVFAIVKPF